VNVAIVGSNSWIAGDLAKRLPYNLTLFHRDNMDQFGTQKYAVIINCIGNARDQDIVETTVKYDSMILEYVKNIPDTKYIFFSSGAAYGFDFGSPVDWHSPAVVDINQIPNRYASAKLMAELRHRALPDLPIVDVRLFSYFSETVNPEAGLLMSQVVKCIKHKLRMNVQTDLMIRDYIGADDLANLIKKIIDAPSVNMAIDVVSKETISVNELVAEMMERYGLKVAREAPQESLKSTTGTKPRYYSENRAYEHFGWNSTRTSLETIILGMDKIFVDSPVCLT
jgi:nucleoside-diphosphate-sugar epimerase